MTYSSKLIEPKEEVVKNLLFMASESEEEVTTRTWDWHLKQGSRGSLVA